MIINFNKKRRILVLIFILILTSIGGLILINNHNSSQAINIIDNKALNNYIIDVVFDNKTKTIKCNQNLTYVNNTGQKLDKIYLHIYPNAFSKESIAPFEEEEMKKAYPNGFNKGYIDIKNILNNKEQLSYNIHGDKNDILEIELNKELLPNEKYSIDFKYNVKIPNCLGRFGYGQSTINITNWFPIACVYDDRGWNLKSYETIGDPFYSEISNFNITVLTPSKYDIATTGNINKEDVGKTQKLYKMSANRVRDFAMILSDEFIINKDSYEDTTIITYNLNKDLVKESTKIARDSIKIFSELFGKYPYKTYSVVSSDFFIGGMEYPTLVMIDKTLYNKENEFLLEYVIAHETAHQWWYSVIGNDEITYPWIDESLTEYSTILYFENKYGKSTSDKLIRTMELQTERYNSKNMFKSSTDFKNSTEYSLNVYTKGAVVFSKIRKEVGDKVFFNTLREYYQSYMFKNVNQEEFFNLWKREGVDINKIIEK